MKAGPALVLFHFGSFRSGILPCFGRRRVNGDLPLLVLGGLVGGGDANIQGNTAHRRHSLFRGALNRNWPPNAVQAKVTRK